MERTKINIAVCFDAGFVMPTGVMLYSACVNTPDTDIDFHLVMDESVSEKDKEALVKTIELFAGKRALFYDISSQTYINFPFCNKDRLTRSTYIRLFLTEILPQSVEKILYLDGDCIVRHSLLPLWNIDISTYAIGAVFDVSEGDIEYYNRLRYPMALGYFNAGVALINLAYWRQIGAPKLFADYLEQHSDRVKHEDQDVMNVIFKDKKLFIPAKYNLQIFFCWKGTPWWDYWKHENELSEAFEDPSIIHFTGEDKPWIVHRRAVTPYSSTFYKYQKQTVWAGIKIDHRTPLRRLRNYVGDWLRRIGMLKPLTSPYKNMLPVD